MSNRIEDTTTVVMSYPCHNLGQIMFSKWAPARFMEFTFTLSFVIAG